MNIFGRRRILSLPKLFVFSILVSLLLVLLLVNFIDRKFVQENIPEITDRKYVQENIQQITDTGKSDVPVTSFPNVCPPRSILNNSQVKVHGSSTSSEEYYLTIGIPTVERTTGNDYLIKTLNSLLSGHDKNSLSGQILIVILLADSDKIVRKKLAENVKTHYRKFIEAGIIDIIQVLPAYYPSRPKLKRRFGDSEARIKWRSKQVIDFSFLFCYCYGLAKYHMQLEDDVVASPEYFPKLKDFIEQYERKETWFTLDASVLGYIGKVYHSSDLQEIATFYYIFFDEMPVDWLEYEWRSIKGQTYRWRFRAASLFQHIGVVSSMLEKKQLAKEPYFDKYTQKFLGRNPPAKLYTDLVAKKGLSLESMYEKGGGYFWAACSDKLSCFVKIIFEKPLVVKRIAIETGANFAPHDSVDNGTLESGMIKGQDCLRYTGQNPVNLTLGILDVHFSERLKVNCLKLVILKQKNWILLREVDIWTEDET